jgi:feruloyl-CoA synthase
MRFSILTPVWMRSGPASWRLMTGCSFPNLAACRALCPDLAPDAAPGDVVGHLAVRARLAAALAAHNAANPGGSRRVTRSLFLMEPPSIDAGEITDKGCINQRAVLARRTAQVEGLHGAPPGPGILDLEAPS